MNINRVYFDEYDVHLESKSLTKYMGMAISGNTRMQMSITNVNVKAILIAIRTYFI